MKLSTFSELSPKSLQYLIFLFGSITGFSIVPGGAIIEVAHFQTVPRVEVCYRVSCVPSFSVNEINQHCLFC